MTAEAGRPPGSRVEPSAQGAPPAGEDGVDALVGRLFRREAGRLVSTLTRIFGPQHMDLAEDVVQDAMVRALRTWPYRGVPDRPAAWLLRVARNRALDRLRRDASLADKAPRAARLLYELPEAPDAAHGPLAADPLRMMFMCCHPALTRDARVTLTLKTVGGLSTDEIARAFLADPRAIAQRIVRAKRKLREAGVEFVMPPASELPARLDSVLDVLYLVFNEGHLAHAGPDLVRAELCADALRLARLLARHPATDLPRVHALCALFCLLAARLPARTDREGALVALAEQDRSQWDGRLIAAGFRHLDASAAGTERTGYHIQAEIAALHASAPTYAETDWGAIVAAYDALLAVAPTAVAAVNRAIAVGMASGPGAGLAALDALAGLQELDRYYPYHAARAEFLRRTGEADAAAATLETALALDPVEPVRRYLERQR